MNSEKLFQILSYSAVFCGFFALWISGVFGFFGTLLFLAAFIASWFIEDTKRQISERLGTVLIVLALPIYWFLWRGGFFLVPSGTDSELPGILARLIVTLSSIKLLQRKSDRDWIFLYLMSFFEVLLAAGLSISILYFLSFLGYIFVMVSAVILFEIRKTGRTHLDLDRIHNRAGRPALPIRRFPATSLVLIVFMVAFAAPMFFMLPRVGGAGFGGGDRGGVQTATGFSDTVTLGGIGAIQQNEAIVMRVRVDGYDPQAARDLRWRGIALDKFDHLSWRKSRPGYPERMPKGDRDLIPLDTLREREGWVQQTVYLEPTNSSILFVLPRAVAIQGPMSYVMRDRAGAIRYESDDRLSYRVFSETALPDPSVLRRDNTLYETDHYNYLQLPDDVDPRVGELATSVTANASNRLDAARAVEAYLQTQYGYTLEQKASGDQPLSDFLFNIRQGHCEYFASAMAIMLRTQGIATRVVNGFQRGEYNETADVFVVRARNAHSWVEVLFPDTDTWVTFDPTPPAAQNLTAGSPGLTKQIYNYLEALETFWIQYFVAYDNAEQRTLLTSVRRSIAEYGKQTSSIVDRGREALLAWWHQVRGDAGLGRSLSAIGLGLAAIAGVGVIIFLFVWLQRRIVRSRAWQRLIARLFGASQASIVEFYDRMQAVLAGKGLVREPHQTPLEFAYAIGVAEVIKLTKLYNAVRFGNTRLTTDDIGEIESSLDALER